MAASNFGKCEFFVPHKDWTPGESVDLLWQNWYAIERFLNSQAPSCFGRSEVVFDQRGLLTAGAFSDPWNHPTGGTATLFTLSLAVAGTTDTVVQLYRAGGSVFSTTIPAGAVYHQDPISIAYRAGGVDPMMIVTPTPGSGAQGLTATVTF